MQQIKANVSTQRLSVEDMAQAEKVIVCVEHSQCFQEEIASLNKGTVKLSFEPVIVDGVLRVGKRLSRAALPEETKHPVILSK